MEWLSRGISVCCLDTGVAAAERLVLRAVILSRKTANTAQMNPQVRLAEVNWSFSESYLNIYMMFYY